MWHNWRSLLYFVCYCLVTHNYLVNAKVIQATLCLCILIFVIQITGQSIQILWHVVRYIQFLPLDNDSSLVQVCKLNNSEWAHFVRDVLRAHVWLDESHHLWCLHCSHTSLIVLLSNNHVSLHSFMPLSGESKRRYPPWWWRMPSWEVWLNRLSITLHY